MFSDLEDYSWRSDATYAGVARDVLRDGNGISGVSHVRAHLSLDDGSQDLRLTTANGIVDTIAKRAAATHYGPDAVVKGFQQELDNAVRVLKGCGRILDSWPSSFELYGSLERAHETHGNSPPKDAHLWTWTGKNWQCSVCLRCTNSPDDVKSVCGRLPLLFAKVLESTNGHRLWMGQLRGLVPPAGLFVYCTKCARHGSPKSVGDLMRPCRGTPGDQYASRHARNFAQGVHPNGMEFWRPWPLGCFSHAAAAQCHVDTVSDVSVAYSGAAQHNMFDDPDADSFPNVGEAESD